MSDFSIKEVLMRRDHMSEEEAIELMDQAVDDLNCRLKNEELPLDICEEWFGLEPDYIDDLMKFGGMI